MKLPCISKTKEMSAGLLKMKSSPKWKRHHFGGKKITVSVMWGVSGAVAVKALKGENRVDSKYFCEEVMNTAIDWCKQKRKVTGISSFIFHMDNAPCHNSRYSKQFMEDNNILRIEHPPYSPDLSPCDFFLFGYMKNHFSNTVFRDEDDAVEEISKWIADIPVKTLIAVFDNWRRRLQLCIENNGEYVSLRGKDYNDVDRDIAALLMRRKVAEKRGKKCQKYS